LAAASFDLEIGELLKTRVLKNDISGTSKALDSAAIPFGVVNAS
jgi:hypothetical protein